VAVAAIVGAIGILKDLIQPSVSRSSMSKFPVSAGRETDVDVHMAAKSPVSRNISKLGCVAKAAL